MNWFLRYIHSDLNDLFVSLNVPADIQQWIMQQPETMRPHYINAIKKNPQMPLQQLQQMTPKVKPKAPQFTEREIWHTETFEEPFQLWARVQFRKMRQAYNPSRTGAPDYAYSREMRDIGRDLEFIYDWWKGTGRPRIDNYTFEQAMQAQDAWHKAMAGKGEGLVYGPTLAEQVVFSPPEWKGWNVQKVITQNDLLVEGNLMSHCVGDYCKQVDSGDTEIYSLRDAQNKPHVTLEISRDNQVQQIYGPGNSEPKSEYKTLIAQWFAELKKTRPIYIDNEFNFDFRRIDNRDIDDAIYAAVNMGNDYGLPSDLTRLDIEWPYDAALAELTRGRDHDTRYTGHIGKAIAEVAWQRDKALAAKTDFNDKKSAYIFDSESKSKGVGWLWSKIDKNNEDFDMYENYQPSVSMKEIRQENPDLSPEQQEELYYRSVEEEQNMMATEARSQYLPYALDDAIAENLVRLRREDPFLADHHEMNARYPVTAKID